MNCNRARELLPLEAYGDLEAAEQSEFCSHLENCDACRDERESLCAVRQSLNAAAIPKVAVDLARIRRDAATMQYRASRRWKKAAFSIGALAAALLIVLLIRPEIQVGGGQLVVRWSERPPEPKREEPIAVVKVPQPSHDADLDERIRILSDLVRTLREDMEASDRARKEHFETLITRVEILRMQSQARYDETRSDVKALYTAHFNKKD